MSTSQRETANVAWIRLQINIMRNIQTNRCRSFMLANLPETLPVLILFCSSAVRPSVTLHNMVGKRVMTWKQSFVIGSVCLSAPESYSKKEQGPSKNREVSGKWHPEAPPWIYFVLIYNYYYYDCYYQLESFHWLYVTQTFRNSLLPLPHLF